MHGFLILLLALLCSVPAAAASPQWHAVPGNIMTRWGSNLSPAHVHSEYPRPTLVRGDWMNLNGLWDYAIQSTNAGRPAQFEGQILVPFPVESALSGVKRRLGASNTLWYHRTFEIPRGWKDQRVLLHFGAVDWASRVWLNGQELGRHEGGYDAFTFDVTDSIKAGSSQELVLSAWDPSDEGPQPRGKQVHKPGGIWYTPTSGIWQTVWLEPVNTTSIEKLRITPILDQGAVEIIAATRGSSSAGTVEAEAYDGAFKRGSASGKPGEKMILTLSNPKPWSPESPHLYDLKLTLKKEGKVVDRAKSYFGLRKISLARNADGILKMQLNNQDYFQLGPLDQGFWPDGLYTAPTDEALRYDIEVTKKLGFNMARKHVKVEPERWYYWCDKLGLLVWQDMPSGDKSAHWRGPSGFDGEEMQRQPASKSIYERELAALLEARHNHPSIVTWVPFNEGWGQFETVRILNWTKQHDPSRLVDGASGGNHFSAGDLLDHHQYPGPGAPVRVTDRAMVLGEFGGLGLPVKSHTWQEDKNWGYRNLKSADEVTANYVDLLEKLAPLSSAAGLSAAIYTQTTDVEVEVNGLMTYDRAIIKMDQRRVRTANSRVAGK